MTDIDKKKAKVLKTMRKRRKRLIKMGLCRDCGLNPAAQERSDKRNRKPTLCEGCRRTRREGALARREREKQQNG